MERKNGFIDLDLYFRNLGKNGIDKSKLIQESKDYDDQYWLTINGDIYYFKETFSLYEELVASECAKFLGVNAVEYDLAKFKVKQGVISKSYRKPNCKYISGEKILSEYATDPNNKEILINLGGDENKLSLLRNTRDLSEYIHTLEVIWLALAYHYKKLNINDIMKNIVKQFCFDLIIGQFDGYPQNWEIEESVEGITLMPYFDGSATFGILKAMPKPRQSLSVNFHDKGTDNYQILETFLSSACTEDINIFLEMFNKLNIHNFTDVLDAVEKRIDSNIPFFIKDRMILEFVRNRNLLQEVINKCIKIRTL